MAGLNKMLPIQLFNLNLLLHNKLTDNGWFKQDVANPNPFSLPPQLCMNKTF